MSVNKKEIEDMRQELNSLVNKSDYIISKEVIELSQDLDKLIVQSMSDNHK